MSASDRPKVSVLVPVYNTERYLGRCLESLLSQTLKDIEVVVVDDGSSDGSPGIINAFAQRDSRVRPRRQENQGLGATRNTGLRNAHGEFIAFIDADDWVEPGFCEDLYAEATRTGADLVVCAYRIVRGDTAAVVIHPPEHREKGAYLLALLALRVPGFSWNKLYRRSLLEGHRLFFPTRDEIENVEDQFFSLRVIHLARTIAFLDHPLVNYRIHASSIVQRYQRTAFRDILRLFTLNEAFVMGRGGSPDEVRALEVAFLVGVFGCMLNECKVTNPRTARERAAALAGFGRDQTFRRVFDRIEVRRSIPVKRRLLLRLVRSGWPRVAYSLCQWQRNRTSGGR